jgi:branched-chain amino acid transport system substrate-binding protein
VKLTFRICVLVLLIASLTAGGCSPAPATNEIRIGHYASLTGPEATYGTSTDNGVRMAVEEINAAGGIDGKTVRLITYDDRGDAKEASLAVTRLITNDSTVAVIGEMASRLSLAAAPICQEHQVPMISTASTSPAVTQVGDMIFRVCYIDPFQGSVCARFARENERLKVSKAAVFYDRAQPYSLGLIEAFSKTFTELGGTITASQSFQEGDTEFTAQLTQLQGSNPEVLFVPTYYSQIGNIARQARALGIKVPLIGVDGWDSPQLIPLAGEALEGCYFSNHYSPESDDPRVKKFQESYRSKFSADADGLAALGYDAAQVLFAAMKRSGSLAGKDLANAISQTKDFPGVSGMLSLDENRNAIKSVVMLEIRDGKVRYVMTVPPDAASGK